MYFSIAAVAATWLVLLLGIRIAPYMGLLDQPGHPRKAHQKPVPLVGGIAIYSGIALAILVSNPSIKELYFLLAGAILVIVGALDDRFDLGVKVRILAQIVATLVMVLGAGVVIESLGNLLGFGEITLGLWAVPFTVLAVVGIINAFNMVDGIDGLAGCLTLVALCGIGILSWFAGQIPPWLLWLTVLAVVPYLICNLQLPGGRGKQVFLGDAGSMLLGFIVAWLLIDMSSGDAQALAPVTALWLVAIPLLDILAVMARRIGCGFSPFHPDRRHLHHLLLKRLHNARQALLLLLLLGILLAGTGIMGELLKGPDFLMFYIGLLLFLLYYSVLSKPRRLLRWLRSQRSSATWHTSRLGNRV